MLSPEMAGATFIFALGGSLHCSAMCGPLAARACLAKRQKVVSPYFGLARLLTYTFLGFVAGLVSASLFRPVFAGFTHSIAYVFAVVMLVSSILLLLQNTLGNKGPFDAWFRPFKKATSAMRKLSEKLPFSEPVRMGILTGLLPCGFLYSALMQAAATLHPVHGAAIMAIFAVGTSPALYAGAQMTLMASRGLNKRLAAVLPVVSILLAGMVIWRTVHTHEHPPPERTEQPDTMQHHHH